MSPFDLIDPQYGWFSPDQEDQGIPIPAAPGLVANAPAPSFLDRLKSIFMPSQAQAAEPQGGGMDIGALLPGMILTQLGQQMQLPRNQRNPAAIPQAIVGVMNAQRAAQKEAIQNRLTNLKAIKELQELQQGKIPTNLEAAIVQAKLRGDKEGVKELLELQKQFNEKPEKATYDNQWFVNDQGEYKQFQRGEQPPPGYIPYHKPDLPTTIVPPGYTGVAPPNTRVAPFPPREPKDTGTWETVDLVDENGKPYQAQRNTVTGETRGMPGFRVPGKKGRGYSGGGAATPTQQGGPPKLWSKSKNAWVEVDQETYDAVKQREGR